MTRRPTPTPPGVYSVALADFKRLVEPTVMNLTRMRMSDLMSDSL
jgi:hypothetical protein